MIKKLIRWIYGKPVMLVSPNSDVCLADLKRHFDVIIIQGDYFITK
jgi:hypothetical protein